MPFRPAAAPAGSQTERPGCSPLAAASHAAIRASGSRVLPGESPSVSSRIAPSSIRASAGIRLQTRLVAVQRHQCVAAPTAQISGIRAGRGLARLQRVVVNHRRHPPRLCRRMMVGQHQRQPFIRQQGRPAAVHGRQQQPAGLPQQPCRFTRQGIRLHHRHRPLPGGQPPAESLKQRRDHRIGIRRRVSHHHQLCGRCAALLQIGRQCRQTHFGQQPLHGRPPFSSSAYSRVQYRV